MAKLEPTNIVSTGTRETSGAAANITHEQTALYRGDEPYITPLERELIQGTHLLDKQVPVLLLDILAPEAWDTTIIAEKISTKMWS